MLSGHLASAQGDIACALTQTLRQLDADFLDCQSYTEEASAHVSSGASSSCVMHAAACMSRSWTMRLACLRLQVRATSGASGSVAYLSTSTQMLHVASVGGSNVIMGELLHGLAKQVAEAAFLSPHAEAPSLIGMGRLRGARPAGDTWPTPEQEAALHRTLCFIVGFSFWHAPLGEAATPGCPCRDAQERGQPWGCSAAVQRLEERAGSERGGKAAAACAREPHRWGARLLEPGRACRRCPARALLLEGEGGQDAMPPVMLRHASQHTAVSGSVKGVADAQAIAADPHGSADTAVPHTADHLVCFAAHQESARLPRYAVSPYMQHLSAVLEDTTVAPSFNTVPHARRLPGMDLAALVLTLKWPANSINQAFADSSVLERLRRSPEREAAPLGQAQRHWRLIRTLCIEYTRARRCCITKCCHASQHCASLEWYHGQASCKTEDRLRAAV